MQDSPGQPPPSAGWRLARPQVVAGGRDGCDVDLVSLRRNAAQLDPDVPIEQHLRQLHLACDAISSVLLSPWVCDGTTLSAEPTNLGLRMWDGHVVSAWAAGVMCAARAPIDVGRACGQLLAPVVEEVAHRSGRHRRVIARVGVDRLLGEIVRLRAHATDHVTDGDILEFLVGCGETTVPPRTITVRPDDGPPVRLHAPRTCCVLSAALDPAACPTCPRHSNDDERRRAATAWLRSLDAGDFHAIAGRNRNARQ